jgi:hypothetical protein
MVHPNKEAAIAACHEYNVEAEKLRQRLGVYEECEDSCCTTYIKTRYVDEHGKEQTYSTI